MAQCGGAAAKRPEGIAALRNSRRTAAPGRCGHSPKTSRTCPTAPANVAQAACYSRHRAIAARTHRRQRRIGILGAKELRRHARRRSSAWRSWHRRAVSVPRSSPQPLDPPVSGRARHHDLLETPVVGKDHALQLLRPGATHGLLTRDRANADRRDAGVSRGQDDERPHCCRFASPSRALSQLSMRASGTISIVARATS